MRKSMFLSVVLVILVAWTISTAQEGDSEVSSASQDAVGAKKFDPNEQKKKVFRTPRIKPTGVAVKFKHQGFDRHYRIHVPKSLDEKTLAPLVLCLHGGGGNSEQGSVMGMTPLADEQGFIVVYPNGLNGHWNDGRKSKVHQEQDKHVDDVGFLMSIVEQVKKKHNVDAKQIFATGVSNGGFMTQRLAMEQSETFSAVGIIVASMGLAIEDSFDPEFPVSVLFMNGTADPAVPYDGGRLTLDLFPRLRKLRGMPLEDRGSCISTDAAVKHWVDRNGIKSKPVVSTFEDVDKSDSSSVELSLWKGGERSTAVALYKVIGGGHGIPGRPQRMERIAGKYNQDIDAWQKIWEFFQTHRRDSRKLQTKIK